MNRNGNICKISCDMRLRQFFLMLLLGLLGLAGCADPFSRPDPVTSIVAVSSSDELWWISLTSRPDLKVGAIKTSSGEALRWVWDLAWDGRSDYAWAVAFQGSQLYKVRLADASASYVGLIGASVNALAVDSSGKLIAAGGTQLYQLDPRSGQAIPYEGLKLPCASSGDLVFFDGRLLASVDCGLGDVLVEVNFGANSVRTIGPIGYSQVYGLSEKNGVLYGATERGDLITIDATTGQGRFLRRMPFGVYGTQAIR